MICKPLQVPVLVNGSKQDHLEKSTHIAFVLHRTWHPVTLVIHCAREEHRQGHAWTCVRGTDAPQCPWHGGKTTAGKEPLLLCKYQAIFICTDLLSVSNLLNSSLAREEAEDRT